MVSFKVTRKYSTSDILFLEALIKVTRKYSTSDILFLEALKVFCWQSDKFQVMVYAASLELLLVTI